MMANSPKNARVAEFRVDRSDCRLSSRELQAATLVAADAGQARSRHKVIQAALARLGAAAVAPRADRSVRCGARPCRLSPASGPTTGPTPNLRASATRRSG